MRRALRSDVPIQIVENLTDSPVCKVVATAEGLVDPGRDAILIAGPRTIHLVLCIG